MAIFKIEYVETMRAYFGVEAATEEEALERFDKWLWDSEDVRVTINNTSEIDCDYFINDKAVVYEEDILTDEMYQEL